MIPEIKIPEIGMGFKVFLPQKNQKKKICTLCYGTGSITQPNGIKIPCPKGCPGFYPLHR